MFSVLQITNVIAVFKLKCLEGYMYGNMVNGCWLTFSTFTDLNVHLYIIMFNKVFCLLHLEVMLFCLCVCMSVSDNSKTYFLCA